MQYAEGGNSQVDYVDDAQIYEDEHGSDRAEQYDYEDGSNSYSQDTKEYYQYPENGDDPRRDGRTDTW